MRLKRLSPAEEPADLALAFPVFRDHFAEAMPGFPEAGPARVRLWMSDGYRSYSKNYGVFADDAPDGPALALLNMSFELDQNTDLANALFAMPRALRDSGVGQFALREARRLAAEEGRTRLVTDFSERVEPEAFCLGAGGKHVFTAIRSVLDLAAVDREQYAQWAAPSAKNADYRLVRWVDRCPEELAETYARAGAAMDDAPLENMALERPKPTVERMRAIEKHTIAYGVRRFVQAAVDAAGEIAGFHMFVSVPDEPEVLDVWDTCVVREHRGHGLGMRIKAAAGLWALEELPEARWVHTFNNHGNTHMLNVNDAFGYRRAEKWLAYEFPTGS